MFNVVKYVVCLIVLHLSLLYYCIISVCVFVIFVGCAAVRREKITVIESEIIPMRVDKFMSNLSNVVLAETY